jgi:hypothetical protein
MPGRAGWRRWVARGMTSAAALTMLVIVVVLVVHAAPVRSAVLRRAALFLAERYGVLRADSLNYNLFSASVLLSGVSMAATGTAEEPFLRASAIEARLPASVPFGAVAVDSLRIDDARLALRWRADGSSNLPSVDSGDEAGPPAALEITRLGGGVSFDGCTLSVAQFAAATGDAELTADGGMALLVAEPSVDLRLKGSGGVSDLARWTTTAEVPDGRVSFSGRLAGPIASPAMVGQMHSDSLSYQGLVLSNLDADVNADRTQLDATRSQVSTADGRVTGTGRLMFDSGSINATAAWSQLSVEMLAHFFSRHDTSIEHFELRVIGLGGRR